MISASIPNSWKRDILQDQAAYVYKIALYGSGAKLDKLTEAYTPQGEVKGQGYTAGGLELSGFTVGEQADAAFMQWTADAVWPNATVSARGALIYNASKGNRAVAVFDFGAEITSSNGPFTVVLTPESGPLLRAK